MEISLYNVGAEYKWILVKWKFPVFNSRPVMINDFLDSLASLRRV